jgi:small multidrug resistance pump
MPNFLLLAVAITGEVIATTALKYSQGFTQWRPTIIVVLGYGVAFYCLSLTLKTMPVGVVYAIWSGLGIVLISVIGWVWLGQKLDFPAIAGMALILAGVLVVNLFSGATAH